MGVRQGLASLRFLLVLSALWTAHAFAQAKSSAPAQQPAASTPAASGPASAAASGSAESDANKAPANPCPAAAPEMENPTRLRTLPAAPVAKKYKVRLDKGGKTIGLPAPANETPPAKGECYYVLAANQIEVVAEMTFQKVQKNKKGIAVWVFTPARRSEAGKTTLNLNAVRVSELPAATPDGSAAGAGSMELLPAENAFILPMFIVLQNAQHQAANVRSGLALNIPVSGFGAAIETFVPKMKTGTWTNMIGLRFNYASWKAEKFSFKKPVSNEVQDASATGTNLELDLVFRYPMNFKIFPRVGVFISPFSKQTEILKVLAGSSSPQNTQTLTRSGLLVGAEAELQPASNFFLGGRVLMSFKETVTVSDETEPGEKLSGTGSATRLHLTGVAGVRLPLTESRRFVFEGLVGNTYRTDKYSEEISYAGQGQQSDVVTYMQAGFGFIL